MEPRAVRAASLLRTNMTERHNRERGGKGQDPESRPRTKPRLVPALPPATLVFLFFVFLAQFAWHFYPLQPKCPI